MIHFVFKEPGSPGVLGPPRELFAVWCNAMLSCAIWCNSKSPKHGCKEVDLKEKFCPQKKTSTLKICCLQLMSLVLQVIFTDDE
jgi:hypothetical protein